MCSGKVSCPRSTCATRCVTPVITPVFVDRIYPIKVEIKDTTDTARSASCLNISLENDSEGPLKHYDKCNDFSFDFVSRWFSPGTPASSTTKTGRLCIAEIWLKVALNTNKFKFKILFYERILSKLPSLKISTIKNYCSWNIQTYS
jgi:hypothetical protein